MVCLFYYPNSISFNRHTKLPWKYRDIDRWMVFIMDTTYSVPLLFLYACHYCGFWSRFIFVPWCSKRQMQPSKTAIMTGSLPSELITWLALGLIGAYAINAVQLFLSLIIRNFVLPIILAFIGGITGLVFIAKDIPYFLPYSLFALGMTEYNTTLNLPLFLICSLIFIGLFLLLSVIYLLFTDTCSQK